MDESTDAPFDKKGNYNHKLLEERNDEYSKVKVGYDDGKALEEVVNNEI